ncbi:MAG: hypothetical protein Q9164_001533 [Protoblastenia rupestris]
MRDQILELKWSLQDIYGHANSKSIAKVQAYNPHPYYPEEINTFSAYHKPTVAWKRRFMHHVLNASLTKAAECCIIAQVQNLCEAFVGSVSEVQEDGWSKSFDMGEWTYYYSLDVISQLIFRHPLGLLNKPDNRWLPQALTEGNVFMYLGFASPNLFQSRLATWLNLGRWVLPQTYARGRAFDRLSRHLLEQRDKIAMDGKEDIISLFEATVDTKTCLKMTNKEIETECLMLFRAGGDTISTALAAVFFYLSREPSAYACLTHEIRTSFTSLESIRQGPLLSSCKFLRACLDEAMRLSPPAPGAFWREVTADTLIDGVKIRKGCEVAVGLYAVHHNFFEDAWTFQPERFLSTETKGATSKSKTAFSPFLLGARACVARELAYSQMTLALARIIWSLDFQLVGTVGQGKKGDGWGRERENEFQIRDIFASDKKGPMLRFKKRKDV